MGHSVLPYSPQPLIRLQEFRPRSLVLAWRRNEPRAVSTEHVLWVAQTQDQRGEMALILLLMLERDPLGVVTEMLRSQKVGEMARQVKALTTKPPSCIPQIHKV